MDSLTTEVLIAGGGPAGSTVARFLSENGIENIIIERNPKFNKPCGGGIRESAFKEFKIPETLVKVKINSFSLVSPDNEKIDINLPEKNSIFIVNRMEFDSYLREEAVKAGSKILNGNFRNFEIKNNHVISNIFFKNKFIRIKSKYLIIATGVNSFTGKKILTISGFSNKLKIDNLYFLYGKNYSTGYYGWIFNHGDSIQIGTVGTKTHIQNICNYLNIETPTKLRGYYIPLWKKTKFSIYNKIFYVGDSASQVLPFSYEGIYFAMKSAKILAYSIINNTPESYNNEWNKKFLSYFKFMKILEIVFLKNDFAIKKLVKAQRNKKIHESSMNYWTGKKIPGNFLKTLYSSIKFLLKIV